MKNAIPIATALLFMMVFAFLGQSIICGILETSEAAMYYEKINASGVASIRTSKLNTYHFLPWFITIVSAILGFISGGIYGQYYYDSVNQRRDLK